MDIVSHVNSAAVAERRVVRPDVAVAGRVVDFRIGVVVAVAFYAGPIARFKLVAGPNLPINKSSEALAQAGRLFKLVELAIVTGRKGLIHI